MKIQYDKEDLREVVEAVAAEMIKGQAKTSSSINDLNDWIRADDLYSRKLFSKATLIKYHKKGLIGKSTIGGTVCYYIPDILQLLKANYYKPEAIDRISDELRKSNEGNV